jgi:hypothetical protein
MPSTCVGSFFTRIRFPRPWLKESSFLDVQRSSAEAHHNAGAWL